MSHIGIPEKIISVYFDTGETDNEATDFNDTYHELINRVSSSMFSKTS